MAKADAASSPPSSEPISVDRGVVLIVDDDESLRETIADLLDVAGFHPITAHDASQALLLLREERVIHALISDLAMPGIDGIALIRQARAIRPDLPAILLTGYADHPNSVATDDSGNYHILRKPVTSESLIRQLESLLSKPANR